jgi:hypothetical protein
MTIKSTTVRTGNISVVNKEIKEFQLGENDYEKNLSYTDSGSGSTLANFLLVGQISASLKIKGCDAATPASDGSQYPLGFLWLGLAESIAVAAGVTRTGLSVITKGRIDESLISFQGSTTLNTILSGRTVRQWLCDKGIIFINPSENTSYTEE